MDTHNAPRPSRRTVLASAAASAFVAATFSGTAPAHARRRAVPAPETVDLPDGIRPEGITSGPGTTFYVGSLADGRIVTGDLLTGSVSVLLPGAAGRSLRGLFHDAGTGLVWAAGGDGTGAHVWAVDTSSGAVVSDTPVPGAVFLNDLVVAPGGVWVTDSRVDRLTVVPLDGSGMPTGGAASFVALTGDWPPSDGTSINANGIRLLPDGSIVLNNSAAGGLWRVDPASGVTTEIPVSGGPGLTGGDGLEVDGHVLYDVRGSGTNEVSVLRLKDTGSGWAATWVGARSDATLEVPSTATLTGGWLWAVNARFGVPSPGTAPYWVTRLPAV
jgi:sugar lactone lactonase YvrE